MKISNGMSIKKSFIFIAIFIIIVTLLLIKGSHGSNKPIGYIKIGGQNIKIELAITPAEQERGLSGKTELKENESMLFVFDHPDKHYFWMKDMNFPIDIIWLNDNGEILYIEKDAWPESYPKTFGPEMDSKYVLEVIAGFSEKNNLKVGDEVEFIYSN